MMYPLNSKMGNGAKVSDWLGTAALAARLAARTLEKVRHNNSGFEPEVDMGQAVEYLEQALTEARAVMSHAAHVAAYQHKGA